MISVNNIAKEFNGENLFSNVTFNVNKKDCIGLAGKNGAGKTTILRIITGELIPEQGYVVRSTENDVGYLPQEKKITSQRSIIDEVMLIYKDIERLKKRNEEINNTIQDITDYESTEYSELVNEQLKNEEQIRLAEPDKMQGKAERVLKGLGFERKDFNKPLQVFSFGWQMRVELAKLLLVNPFLLLLDEPTNHLDIESIQWLENYLSNYQGAVMIVSHDRTFLDNLTNRTIEINNGKIFDYKVHYSEYIKLREERLLHQKASYNNQQNEIRDIERFIERFRYKASKARQVQSRVKHLNRIDKIEVEDIDKSTIQFSFPPAPHSGKVTIAGNTISKRYGQNLVIKNIDFQILKGEKIAFIGKNGEGKSTLAKIIAQKIDYEGQLTIGYQVVMGYYSQDQWEMLDPNLTVFETLEKIAVGDVRKRLKAILGSFLFRGDDVDKKVKVLSGGEKTRLSLAKLLLVPSNLLVLDEPTNHLDITSKDILKNALLQYNGTLIIISHDRDFLQGLTNRLYEFKNKKIKEFRGDIFEFLENRQINRLQELERKNLANKKKVSKTPENKLRWEERKLIEKRIRKLNTTIESIEKKIETSEAILSELNSKLANPEKYAKEIQSGELYKTHDKITMELDYTLVEWEKLEKEKEHLQSDLAKLI